MRKENENTGEKSQDFEQGYGSHEEGLSPRPPAEESDSSGYSDEENEIFERLN